MSSSDRPASLVHEEELRCCLQADRGLAAHHRSSWSKDLTYRLFEASRLLACVCSGQKATSGLSGLSYCIAIMHKNFQFWGQTSVMIWHSVGWEHPVTTSHQQDMHCKYVDRLMDVFKVIACPCTAPVVSILEKTLPDQQGRCKGDGSCTWNPFWRRSIDKGTKIML